MTTNTNPASTLAACPFCGSTPELHLDKMLGDAWLGCMNKECTVAPYIEAPDLAERGGEASATEAWNRRAHPLTAQVAERQPLTDEQIVDARDAVLPSQGESFDCIAFARAIERAHNIPASGEAKSHE